MVRSIARYAVAAIALSVLSGPVLSDTLEGGADAGLPENNVNGNT